jgi:hypothetical protein
MSGGETAFGKIDFRPYAFCFHVYFISQALGGVSHAEFRWKIPSAAVGFFTANG